MPPPATFNVPEIVGVKVKVPVEFVIAMPWVWPFAVTVEEASVMAPVWFVPKDCATEVTPVFVMVRPEPMMYWLPVTLMPVPEETVPVAAEFTTPLVP